ncbi:hypothetical protein [Aeromicrobium sp. 179-A 4D2 NHS]|uniref:hypothetical protein n=1 Tax=Aeromicrobium sp. 179-A 4D2 NHS TaxID=3142375 RepID=UPI0039A0231A
MSGQDRDERICPTDGCPGDGRYAPPGRGHLEGCNYLTPAKVTSREVKGTAYLEVGVGRVMDAFPTSDGDVEAAFIEVDSLNFGVVRVWVPVEVLTPASDDVSPREEPRSMFRDVFEESKRRNAMIPEHARMVVTNPALSAHTRPAEYKADAKVGRWTVPVLSREDAERLIAIGEKYIEAGRLHLELLDEGTRHDG